MSDNLSPWQQYKKNLGSSRPWHLLNSDNYIDTEIQKTRFSFCKQCPELIQATSQCKKCGCMMKYKTKLKNAVCPIGKW